MTKSRGPAALAADVAASLMWGPKSLRELADAVLNGNVNRSVTVERYISQFHETGCIYVSTYNDRGKPVYAWNFKPFALPDAQPDPGLVPSMPVASGGRPGKLFDSGDGMLVTMRQAASISGLSYEIVRRRVLQGMPMVEILKSKRKIRLKANL